MNRLKTGLYRQLLAIADLRIEYRDVAQRGACRSDRQVFAGEPDGKYIVIILFIVDTLFVRFHAVLGSADLAWCRAATKQGRAKDSSENFHLASLR
jgi:hypothetical protein